LKFPLLAECEQVQIFELRVKLCCDNCVNKVKKKIEKMDGILLPTLNVNEMKAFHQLIFQNSSNYVLMQCSVSQNGCFNVSNDDVSWQHQNMMHLCTSKRICSPYFAYLYLASIHIGEFLFFRD